MKLLLDQGTPLTAAAILRERGMDAWHTAEIGMRRSPDEEILLRARAEERVLITLDRDFPKLLALSRALSPSVIQVRIPDLKAPEFVECVLPVLARFQHAFLQCVMVSITPLGARMRRLPLR